MLIAKQICCEKQGRILFQDIDLSIESGELVLLKGENGAGKTSLLRILVGLSIPASGSVTVNNISVHNEPNQALQQILYIGHKLGLNALLTPFENLQFFNQMCAYQNSNEFILETLDNLGLVGLDDIPVKSLSAGQQRRVALAKLWLHKSAKLWVLDEPFTALDVGLVSMLEQQMLSFIANGGAVLMTSHQTLSITDHVRTVQLEYNW